MAHSEFLDDAGTILGGIEIRQSIDYVCFQDALDELAW